MKMPFATHSHFVGILRFFRVCSVQDVTRLTITWSALVVMSLSTVACTSLAPTSTPQTVATSTVARSSTPGHISTPQIVATYMTALLIGKLVKVDNCLRVNDTNPDTSYLLVWPPDFAVSIEKDEIQIVKQDGKKVVLHLGEMIRISGGEVWSARFLDEQVRQKLPSHCPGPYWVVGTEVAPVATVYPEPTPD